MKKLFKLFPLALAALTFASCSDDLNIANGEKELAYSPDKLLVQIEDDGSSDVTRGGYVTNIYNYNLYSALAFDAGETLKLYHDATSWRPEIWTATTYDQYKNVVGTTAFKKEGATIIKEENAYGIYPSTASVFGNEDRTSIRYDLSDLAFVDYSIDATKSYAGTTGEGAITKYYKAEFPLWGVKEANAEVMTMKHLAGILRLDIADITDNGAYPLPTADGQYRYVIVRSNAKKLTGVIETAGELLNPTALEKLDPTTFMTTTPRLEVEDADNAAALDVTPITAAAAAAADNVIVIRIDKNTTDKHVMAYFPILPQMVGGDVDIFVTPNITPGANTTIDLNDVSNIAFRYALTAAVIKECNDAYQPSTKPYAGLNTVQRGVTYKINDDRTNVNTDAKTPFQLAEGIIAADKKAYRDFDVYFTQPIEVKNTDDSPQNFWMNLAGGDARYGLAEGWALKHNVTVHLTLKENAEGASKPSVLYIKTKEGSKKLTLVIDQPVAEANRCDSVVIKDGDLKSELVLKSGDEKLLPNIHIGKNNYVATAGAEKDYLTVAAGAKKIVSNSNFTLTTGNNAADNVDILTIGAGTKKITIKGGRITTALLADGTAATTDKINSDVTIYTEGNASIGQISYKNMPKGSDNKDSWNINYESKYVPFGGAVTNPVTKVLNGSKTIENCVITAAQLSKMVTPATLFTVIGTFDLDGTHDVAWTSLSGLTSGISGAKWFRSETATLADANITGVATIKNLKGENGLLADWAPAAANDCISNFTFEGRNTISKTAGTALGLLVGTAGSANDGIIKNITLNGTNTIQDLTVGKNAACIAIGGVIGKKVGDGTLKLANVQVGSGTSVYGFKNIGGIIGEINGKVIFGAQKKDGSADKFVIAAPWSDYAADDVLNKSEATLTTILVASAPASPNLPTVGQFFGGANMTNDGDVAIIGGLSKLGTARQSTTTGVDWGYYLPDVNSEYWKWLAYLNYNEIGHYGYEVVGGNAVNWSGKAVNVFTKANDANKYSVSTAFKGAVGTAPVDGTPAGTKYFGYVIKPY